MTSSILSLSTLLLNNVGQTTASPANTQQGLPLPQSSQNGSFGAAVVVDLSQAATAAMNGGQSTSGSTTNPISNISANFFSNMALTYSAGNTGALDTNNSFFDQLFGGAASASASGTGAASGSATSGSAASGTSGTTSVASNTSINSTSDSSKGTSSTTGAQGHSGHHHHGGGGAASASSSSGSGSGVSINSQDPLAQLLSSLDGSSDSTAALLASII